VHFEFASFHWFWSNNPSVDKRDFHTFMLSIMYLFNNKHPNRYNFGIFEHMNGMMHVKPIIAFPSSWINIDESSAFIYIASKSGLCNCSMFRFSIFSFVFSLFPLSLSLSLSLFFFLFLFLSFFLLVVMRQWYAWIDDLPSIAVCANPSKSVRVYTQWLANMYSVTFHSVIKRS